MSIGTQSLMHPVDWLEVNANAGMRQPDIWENAPPVDDGWLAAGDTSILRTPMDRKTGGKKETADTDSEADESIRHEVETALTFPLAEALHMGALLDLMHRLQVANATMDHGAACERSTPSCHSAGCAGGDEMPPPFSSIKRGSGAGKNMLLQPTPLQQSAQGHRVLTRSKRSLFDVRVSLDDSEDDEHTASFSEDENTVPAIEHH